MTTSEPIPRSITLKHPPEGGPTALVFARIPTVGDQLDASRAARETLSLLPGDSAPQDLTEVHLVAILTDCPFLQVRAIRSADYGRVQAALVDLLVRGGGKKEPSGAKP